VLVSGIVGGWRGRGCVPVGLLRVLGLAAAVVALVGHCVIVGFWYAPGSYSFGCGVSVCRKVLCCYLLIAAPAVLYVNYYARITHTHTRARASCFNSFAQDKNSPSCRIAVRKMRKKSPSSKKSMMA